MPTRSMRRRSLILAVVIFPGRRHTFVPASARIGPHYCRRGMLSGYMRRRLIPTRSIMRIVILAVVVVTGLLHAVVPAPVRNTAPVAFTGLHRPA